MAEKHKDIFPETLIENKKKKLFFLQPDNLFLLLALLLAITPFFLIGESVSIHLHDTYFIISNNFFIYFLAIAFLAIWIVYKLAKRVLLTKYLTWLHLITCLIILAMTLMDIRWFISYSSSNEPRDILFRLILNNQFKALTFSWPFFTVFIAGQLAFLINLLGGIADKMSNPKKPLPR